MPLAGFGDRLVTEALPLLDKAEEGFVHYFCTTLFAPTAPLSQAKVAQGREKRAWIEQWGGAQGANATPTNVKPLPLPQVQEQWVWEIRSWDKAEVFGVKVPLQRPRSLWCDACDASTRLVVYASDPGVVRGTDAGEVGQGFGAVLQVDQGKVVDQGRLSDQGKLGREMRLLELEVNCRHCRHDASPVYVHITGEKGKMSHLPLVLTFQEKAAARVAPCGLRITLAQLPFADSSSSLTKPSGGGDLTIRFPGQSCQVTVSELKMLVRTDLARTLACDISRVQLLQLARKESTLRAAALEVFLSLDDDESGYLDRWEVRRALKLMRKHGLIIDDDDYVLPLLDPSGDGKVSFDEFLAVLDAGVDVHLLILPPLLHEHEHHHPHHHPELQPLEMAEAFYQRVCDSVSAKGNGGGEGGGEGELMGVMGFCAEVEVLATSTVGLRGQSFHQQKRMSESAIKIQRAHRSSMQLKRTREAVRYSRESQGQAPGQQRSWTRNEAAPKSAPASQPDSDGQGDIDRQAEGSSGNHDTELLTFENPSKRTSQARQISAQLAGMSNEEEK